MRLGVRAAMVGRELVAGDVQVSGGTVVAVGVSPGGVTGIAAPGFVDLQVNGFAGVDFLTAPREEYAVAGEAILATGCTAFQPTFLTASEERLTEALRRLPAGPVGPRVIGAHLEGPFLAEGRLGVHPAEHRRDPGTALMSRLLAAGPVSQVTVAPELPGAADLIDVLLRAGVVVSAGHSDATAAEANRAFGQGVGTVTHLYNAMRPPMARQPGLAFAALAHPEVTVQLIADGHHIADEALLVAMAAARGRFALVTDATAAAASEGGPVELAGRAIRLDGGRVVDHLGRLAGSALTMIDAVRRTHQLGIPLPEALHAASTTPARVVRRSDLGSLRPGSPADIVVLDDRLDVLRVLVAGEERFLA